ncbi:uncharacterized protein ACNLHF_018353 isoform 1-T6 [Anomaloglossus baeobatrachus]
MWSFRLHIMIFSALVYIGILYRCQGLSCAGDRVIIQHPGHIKAKAGDNVSFSCTIDKYKVDEISVVVDTKIVMRKDASHIDKADNIHFHGEMNKFNITVLLRNKSDSNTYFCEARLQGQPTTICGNGSFIEIPIISSGSPWWIILLVVGISIGIILGSCVIYCICRQKN